MSESPARGNACATPAEGESAAGNPATSENPLAIAERWADYTRAFAIYPESNQRVLETRAAFFSILDQTGDGTGTGSTLGIRFSGSEVSVGAGRHDIQPRTNLHWLAHRLEATLLSGIGFQVESLHVVALDSFTRHMLRAFAKQKAFKTFEEIWDSSYDGITLIEKRFDGSFSSRETNTNAAGYSPGNGTQALAAQLLQSQDVKEKLEKLGDQLAPLIEDDPNTRSIDLVTMILDRVPIDVMQSLDRVHDLVIEIIGTLSERKDPKPNDYGEFEELLTRASQQFFARSGPQATSAPESTSSGKGHSGDDAISDDLTLFFCDFEKLTDNVDESIESSLQDHIEQIGVYLYYAAHIESEKDRSQLVGPKLRHWLADPGPDELALLKTYLDHLGDPEHSEKSERVLEILVQQGLGHHLRSIYPQSAEKVLRNFPDGFGLYVASIDPRDTQHRLELEGICSRITPVRMSMAAERLFKRSWELAPARVDALLESGSPSLLGIAHIAIKNGGEPLRSPVVRYLRKIEMKNPEACLLWVLEDLKKISVPYLVTITCPDADGRYPTSLRDDVVDTLCRFIQSLGSDPEQTPRRVYAIKHLGSFPTETSRRYLVDLLSSRYLLIPRESSTVRQAAKKVLRRLSP